MKNKEFYSIAFKFLTAALYKDYFEVLHFQIISVVIVYA